MLMPHLVLRDLLEPEQVQSLFDYAVAHEADFAPSTVSPKQRLDPALRVSLRLGDLGPFRALFEAKLFALLPELVRELRIKHPAGQPKLELELIAHGDGAFFRRHIDTLTGASDASSIRVLSGVYYFHAEPRAFTGGTLRFHPIGQGQGGGIDIEPRRNSLLVFPSWAPHEVLPVHCPSGRFADSRFAINCWVRQPKPGS